MNIANVKDCQFFSHSHTISPIIRKNGLKICLEKCVYTQVGFVHALGSRRHPLPKRLVDIFSLFPFWPPVCGHWFLWRVCEWVRLMDVPLCAANSLARFTVDDLNPTTGGIGLVPFALAPFGFFNRFFATAEWGGENDKEGIEWSLVREKLQLDNLFPVGVRLDLIDFQRHYESTIASVPCFLEV